MNLPPPSSPAAIRNLSIAFLLFLLSLAGFQRAGATLPQLAPGERVRFSDDFNDNSNNWSNIGAASGQAAIGADPGGTGATAWYPSVNSDGTVVSGTMNMLNPVSFANGPVSVYMRVRVDNPNGQDNNRFEILLREQSPNSHYGETTIRPGNTGEIAYYNTPTGATSVSDSSTYSLYVPSNTNFIDFRLLFTPNGNGTATVQAYYYSTATSAYVSLGSVNPAYFTSGVFNQIVILCRNGSGSGNGRAYYDSVMVAQGNIQTGENYLFGDDFNSGLTPDWHFIDSGTTGAVWSTGTDNTSPMSNGVLTNSKPTTQAVVQWDPVTLSGTGDYIVLDMNARTPAVTASGTFQASLLSSASILTGNVFGYTTYPLMSANGYTYSQSYSSSAVHMQRVLNNAATDFSIQSGSSVAGDGAAHTYILTIQRTAAGILYTSNVDSLILTATDTSPSSYTFDTLRIDGGGYPLNIDNVQVRTTRPANNFTFALPHAYETSAGVFNSAGSLVRNLWKKESFPAGAYTRSWDGLDDGGNPLPAGSYTVKALYHNMNYTWEGVIGDTANSFCGSHDYRGLHQPGHMAIDASGDGFISVGYNEGLTGIYRISTSAPNTPSPAMAADQNNTWNYVATDGTNYYLANCGSGWDVNNDVFVEARAVSNGAAFPFTSGTTVKNSGGNSYPGVIDNYFEVSGTVGDPAFLTAHHATGLSVQTSGTILAVSHGGLNEVNLYNKTSGQLLDTFTVSNPRQIAFAPNGDLWVVTGTTGAVCYTGLPSSSPAASGTITGLTLPLAIAVNPNNDDIVLVADAGSSQQVKCFNSAGVSQWTMGQAGGYANGPAVTTNKFWFMDDDKYVGTILAFQGDGSFWVGDPGNKRVLHFSSSLVYSGQIAPLGTCYSMTADPNNPTRIFAGNLEYQVNYGVPLTPGDPDPAFGGNGCWKLVNNWLGGFPYAGFGPFLNVVTLSNNHTYAEFAHSGTTSGINGTSGIFVAELQASGTLRLTGTTPNFTSSLYNLYGNGDIRYSTSSGSANPYTQTIYRESLTGFDGNYNPQWSAATAIASTPYYQGSGTIPYREHLNPTISGGWGMAPRIPITSSNVAVCYNASASSYHYVLSGSTVTVWANPNTHLGGVTLSGSNFLWESSPGALTVQPDGLGTFTDLADYGSQGYGGHCGIGVCASGRNIIYGYDGQYGNFSNQFMHFYDDGLFAGQFGVTTGKGLDKSSGLIAPPGYSGNIGMMMLVTATNGISYVYYPDESIHAGIHRWRVDGTANELGVTGTMGSGTWSGNSNLGTGAAWPATNLVANPGFESEASTYTLSGTAALGYTINPVDWQVNSSDGSGAGAFYTGWMDITGGTSTTTFAHSLPYHATIAKGSAYKVTPYQILGPVPNGTYTLSAWVVSSGGQGLAQMYCKKTPLSSTYDYTCNIPTSSVWTQITIPNIAITGGQAEIGFNVQGNAGEYIYIDDVSFSQ